MVSYLASILQLERSVKLYLIAWAMIGLITFGINAVLSNLWLVELGLSIGFLGTLNASGQVIWAVAALPAGMIGARFGLRGSIAAGFSAVALGLAIFLSAAWLPRSAWEAGLYFSNIIIWPGAALVVVNGAPYLMAMSPAQDRAKAFTLVGALLALTSFLGSLAAGFLPDLLLSQLGTRLTQAGAYNAVMWLSIPAFLSAALLMLKADPAPGMVQEVKNAVKQSAPVGLLLFLGLLFWLQMASESTLNMFLNVYLNSELSVSNSTIGVIFALSRVMPFFLSPLQPLLIKRWGAGLVLTAGYVVVGGCAVLFALVPIWQVTAAGFILFGLASSFSSSARSLFGQEAVEPRWRTTVNAVLTIGMAAGGGLVGFSAGRLIDTAGFRGLFLSGAGLALLAVLLYAAKSRLKAKRPVVTKQEAAG